MTTDFSPADLAAVVVNHNAGGALVDCVASLRKAGIAEIVVVDNASSDGSLARLAEVDRGVTLVPTGSNPGYGAAANRGVAVTDAEFVLICNPDLELDPGAARALHSALASRDDVGVAGPMVVDQQQHRYPSARAFPGLADAIGHAFVGMFWPNNRWSRHYRDEMGKEETEHIVDWVSGAAMLVRKVAFSSIGGFDEGYFMYVEDLDLCWRLRRSGWSTLYVPKAVVTHERGGSSGEHPYRLLVAHHASTWRFARRSATGREQALLPVVGSGIVVRLVVALARNIFKDQAAKWDRRHPSVG